HVADSVKTIRKTYVGNKAIHISIALCLHRTYPGPFFFFTNRRPPRPTLFPYTTLFRSHGLYAGLPVAIGYVPIAIAYGALGVASGLTWWHTVLMSLPVFAGASQFMAGGMLAAGAGAVQIVISTFVLTFRYLCMSLSLFDRLRSFPVSKRVAVALGVTDETFAVLVVRAEDKQYKPTPRFVAGTMLTAYLAWVGGSVIGAIFAEF